MKNALLFAALLLCSILNAQNIKVRGSVKDSVGSPLELANVIATSKFDGVIVSYAIVDPKGEFQIILPDGAAYILTASFLGMKAASRDLDLSPNMTAVDLDFILYPDNNQLEGVELKYQMPVVVRGDTIIYNTDSFTNGNEQKLGDVLKKLPGIQVSKNGDIEVEGKKVSKVMVEGKDFFEGDSKLATKNIPADALSKVEVLKNYNEVDQMRGLGNDQDNIAINLKLKEGKKNFWFGDLEGGLGEGEGIRHLASAKLFYYSPKTSINLLGNLNNTGEVPFTFHDYLNFTGGFRNIGSGGTSLNISDSGLGFLTTQNDRANEIKTRFGAANFSHQVTKSWSLSGFVIYSDNKVNFLEQTSRNYLQTNATEENTSDSDQHSQLGMAKLSSIYKPNNQFQLDYDMLIKKSGQVETANAISVFSEDGNQVVNPITENKKNEPLSVNHNLNLYYTLNAKNIFAGYLRYLYQDEDPFYNAVLQVQPFVNILPLDEQQGNFNINQEKSVRTRKMDSQLDYYFVINDLSNINFTLGATVNNQDFSSAIFQLINSGRQNYFEDDFLNNEVQYKFQDLFVGLHYKIKKGIFTFTPGLTLHDYNLETVQSHSLTAHNKTLVLPDFLAIAQFRGSESLRFNYRMSADFTDVNNFAEGYVFTNYNRLFRGNRDLENAISHNLSLNYINFSMYNFSNITAGINYSKRLNAVRSNTILESINQVGTLRNSNFADENLSAHAGYQKTFRKWKINLDSNIAFSSFNVEINQQEQESKSFTQNYQGSLQTNFKKSPNFEIGYNRSVNQYSNAGAESLFYTDRPFANMEILFLKSFRFDIDYSYYNYTNRENTIQNKYAFLNASLLYRKEGSKWEFKVNATNLLNVETINTDSFNELFNVTSEYFVQPRIVMGSVKFNL